MLHVHDLFFPFAALSSPSRSGPRLGKVTRPRVRRSWRRRLIELCTRRTLASLESKQRFRMPACRDGDSGARRSIPSTCIESRRVTFRWFRIEKAPSCMYRRCRPASPLTSPSPSLPRVKLCSRKINQLDCSPESPKFVERGSSYSRTAAQVVTELV